MGIVRWHKRHPFMYVVFYGIYKDLSLRAVTHDICYG